MNIHSLNEKDCLINIAENETQENITHEISLTFNIDGISLTSNKIHITQHYRKIDEYMLNVLPPTYTFSKNGETKTFRIESLKNGEFTPWSNSDVSYYTISNATDNTFDITCEKNNSTTDTHNETIMFANEGISDVQVALSQYVADPTPPPQSIELKALSQQISFTDVGQVMKASLLLIVNGVHQETTDINLIEHPDWVQGGTKTKGASTAIQTPSMLQDIKCLKASSEVGKLVYEYSGQTAEINVVYKKDYISSGDMATLIHVNCNTVSQYYAAGYIYFYHSPSGNMQDIELAKYIRVDFSNTNGKTTITGWEVSDEHLAKIGTSLKINDYYGVASFVPSITTSSNPGVVSRLWYNDNMQIDITGNSDTLYQPYPLKTTSTFVITIR